MIQTRNLGALFDPQHCGDRTALIDCRHWDSPLELSHRDLDRAASACATALRDLGLRPGDAVGLLSANRSEYLTAYMGILRAGLIAVPINHKFSNQILDFIVADAEIKLVLCDAANRERLAGRLPCLDFDAVDDGGYPALLERGANAVQLPTYDPDDQHFAMVLYTSGSTGRPKGVPLTHAGHLWALRARTTAGYPFHQHRLLVAAPLYHMNALCVSLVAIAGAASEVLLPEFSVERYLAAVERFRCTWLTSVPTMLAMCLQDQERLARTDLSSVSIVRMGSAPVSPKLFSQVRQTFPKASIMNGYGTTETGPVVFGARDARAPPDGSPGWPAPDVQVKLVDEHGEEADQGVLWQRTPATMPFYLNLPEKTREVLTEDGWYISGDIFRRDAEGAYHFVGRDDDMFVCGGENIHPGEVESLLVSHPDVAQSCVVPVADEIKGAKPVAFVVPVPGAQPDEQTLKRYALDNAPAYRHPRRVFVLAELPLAGPGKVDRGALIQRAAALVESTGVEPTGVESPGVESPGVEST
ncbi:MAG: acyl--CoA ligase [Gammaproteobacteria bacterium]|nr:acyl--CoA ligase [Gammaproteobacteria bacterium]